MSRISIGVSRQLRVLESKETCRRELHAQGAEFLMTNASKIRALSCLPWRNLSVRTIFNCFNPPIVEVFKLGSHIISLEVGFDQGNRTCVSCNMNGTTVQSKIVVEPKDGKVLEVYYDGVPKKEEKMVYYDEPTYGDIKDREVVYARVLESNERHDADLLAIIATSAALMISNDTRVGPIGAIRIGRIDEKIIINPTTEEQRESDINLLYVCTREKTVMVDLEAPEISESDLETNLKLAHLEAVKCIDSLVRLRDRYGKDHKSEVLKTISKNMHDTSYFTTFIPHAHMMEMKSEGYQFDRRCLHQIRPIECELGYLPWAHGSSNLSCGVTKVFCKTILCRPDQALRADSLGVPPRKRFRVGYDLGFVNEQLNDILVIEDYDSYYDREISEIMDSTPQSSEIIRREIGEGSIALMDAGIPVRCHVAGVSIGLVTISETSNGQLENYRIITDMLSLEDDLVEMDCKVAGTRNGITAVQLDVNSVGISLDIICEALSYGRQARLQILDQMEQILDSPKITSSILVNPGRRIPLYNYAADVGEVYKCIVTSIREKYGQEWAEVSKVSYVLSVGKHIILKCIKKDSQGMVEFSLKALEEAPEMPVISSVPEVGELYECIVVSIRETFAVVEYNGGCCGVLSVCELSNEKVSKVSDVLSIGKHITLKCIRRRHGDIFEFSLKAVA
ncbi:unnamed protein product [Arabis nemorensis]|uniref:S1 motif domain-containing protein n=1 Tax=Arabis nemorensis TaxID=586526 RepID=A0A565BHW3_9BRAS|nr:unnamed protein product [Arabis nemorensis]